MDPRRSDADARHYRRGFYLLPSMFTVGNMFCGYACIMFAMRGELVTAAPFIGVAVVLDMLDGRIARLTNQESAMGLELDSLADIISFGIAPAVLAFAWGLSDLGRWGWAAGFIYLTCAALRLARFNVQTTGQVDKRYFVGMPSPSAAGVVAATVFAWPYPQLGGRWQTFASIAIVVIPAILMVSTVRYRSFKTLNFGWTRAYFKIVLLATLIAAIATEPRLTLIVLAYTYLVSPAIEMAANRSRAHREEAPRATSP
jgi:CDP-diacylglycerol--serine O-phosphatidyltransferase